MSDPGGVAMRCKKLHRTRTDLHRPNALAGSARSGAAERKVSRQSRELAGCSKLPRRAAAQVAQGTAQQTQTDPHCGRSWATLCSCARR